MEDSHGEGSIHKEVQNKETNKDNPHSLEESDNGNMQKIKEDTQEENDHDEGSHSDNKQAQNSEPNSKLPKEAPDGKKRKRKISA